MRIFVYLIVCWSSISTAQTAVVARPRVSVEPALGPITLSVERRLKNSWFDGQGGDFYLFNDGRVARLDCQLGWDGPRRLYQQSFTWVSRNPDFLTQTTDRISEALRSVDLRTSQAFEFEFSSPDACFDFLDRCADDKGSDWTFHLRARTGKARVVQRYDCPQRPRGAGAPTRGSSLPANR